MDDHADHGLAATGTGYRLAVVTCATFWGGAERFLEHLVAALPADVAVTVLGPAPQVVERIAAGREAAVAVRVPLGVRAMTRALRTLDPDVVHVNLPSFTSCRSAVVAAGLLRLPVVLVDHLPVPGLTWRGRALQRAMTWSAVARVGVGDAASRAVEHFAGLRRGSVLTIRNGVPPPAARRSPVRQPMVLGLLCALEPRKGVDVLLRALPGVPGVTVLVAGDGSQRAELEGLAAALGVADRVRFLGATDDVGAFFEAVDVLVVPSRQEALPLVVLEAMHVGLPVVATSVGSVPEVVADGVTGRVVPPDDPPALAVALREVAADPELAQAYGDAAAVRAAAELTHTAMAERYDAVFRRAAHLRRRRVRRGPRRRARD